MGLQNLINHYGIQSVLIGDGRHQALIRVVFLNGGVGSLQVAEQLPAEGEVVAYQTLPVEDGPEPCLPGGLSIGAEEEAGLVLPDVGQEPDRVAGGQVEAFHCRPGEKHLA